MTVGDLEGEVIFRLRVSCLGHCGPDLPASASRPSSTGQAGFAMLASGRQYWEMTIGNGGGVHEAASEERMAKRMMGFGKRGRRRGFALVWSPVWSIFFCRKENNILVMVMVMVMVLLCLCESFAWPVQLSISRLSFSYILLRRPAFSLITSFSHPHHSLTLSQSLFLCPFINQSLLAPLSPPLLPSSATPVPFHWCCGHPSTQLPLSLLHTRS